MDLGSESMSFGGKPEPVKVDALTGCPILVNTSFNVRGEPIVLSPDDAYTCFMRTGMTHLILDEYIVTKDEQPVFEESKDWREQFELD